MLVFLILITYYMKEIEQKNQRWAKTKEENNQYIL